MYRNKIRILSFTIGEEQFRRFRICSDPLLVATDAYPGHSRKTKEAFHRIYAYGVVTLFFMS